MLAAVTPIFDLYHGSAKPDAIMEKQLYLSILTVLLEAKLLGSELTDTVSTVNFAAALSLILLFFGI